MYDFKAYKLITPHPFLKKWVKITLLIFVVLLLLLLLPWRQTVYGVGTLIPLDPTERNYRILATVDGILEKIYVKENQYVKKGTKLFRMRDLDPAYQKRLENIKDTSIDKLKNEKQKIENFKNNLERQKDIFKQGINVYNEKIIQLENSLKALKNQRIASQNKYKIAQINYKRTSNLYKEGIESKRNIELKENAMLTAQAQYQKIEADIQNIQSQLDITANEKNRFISEMKLKQNSIQNNILSAKNTIKNLQKLIANESVNISRYQSRDAIAKSDGYIIRIYQNDQNKLIKKGEDVLLFAPKVTQRAIRLRVSDFSMPLLKKGLKSRIIFYGWPAIQIAGWPKIAHGTYGGIVKSIEPLVHEKDSYFVLITEDSKDEPWPDENLLRMGTQGSVWVNLSTVTIGYELWRLMLAQPPKMTVIPKDYK